ncbi:MAG: RNA methyltransferase [Prevotella sp.]|nr:RNA methyltransferase [Prevotella sp.]
MISKAKLKYIHSLELKKNRRQEGAFVAEGPKVVGDLLCVMHPTLLIATEEWLHENRHLQKGGEWLEVTDEELAKASFLKHPQQVLAVFPTPQRSMPKVNLDDLSLMLDGVQDPGNVGTIIRIADWFGITDVFCSLDSADVYNPKVVQATMGSIARVNIHYTDLSELISGLPEGFPVYGTLLDGENIYETELQPRGVIVMGNEGNGLSADIIQKLTHRLLIPNYPPNRPTADSLNVAVATAIVCAEFRRKSYSIKP